jgi:chromosome segregation protein
LLAFQIRDIKSQLENYAKSENDRRAESSYAQQQLTSTKAGIHELEQQLVSDDLAQLRQKLFAFEASESKLRSLQNLAQQRIDLLSRQEFSSREVEVADLSRQLESAESELALLEAEIATSSQTLGLLEKQRLVAAEELAEFEAQTLRSRAAVEQRQRERSTLTGQIAVLVGKLEGLQAQISQGQTSIEEIEVRIEQLEKQQADFTPGSGAISDEDLRAAYEQAQLAEGAARSRLDDVRTELHSLERERDAVAAKHSALGLTLDQGDGASEVNRSNLKGIKGLLAESLQIQPGYELAIAVALGGLADAIAVETREAAIAAMNYLKHQGLGRAEFLVVNGKLASGKTQNHAGLSSASAFLKAPESVLSELQNYFVADNLEQAESFLQDPRSAGMKVVTKDGDLVSLSTIRGGGTKAPSKLELAAEREAASQRLVELATQIDEKSKTLESSKDQLQEAIDAVQQALSKLQEHDAELAARAERVGRIIAQLDSARSEKQRVVDEREKLTLAIMHTQTDIDELQLKLGAFPEEDSFESNLDQRQNLVASLESARQEELELRIQIGTHSERRAASARNVATLKGRRTEALSAMERERLASEKVAEQLNQANAVLKVIPDVLRVTDERATSLRAAIRDIEAERIQRTERLATLRSQAQVLEAKLEELNRGVHEVELRNHELRLTLANLHERVSAELHVDEQTLLAETEVTSKSREELERELKSAEQKLSQLGAFNPLALEEFAALEERHKYLSEQLDDLTKARVDLIGIIRDLDQKMQTIFSAAFDDTKREFEKVFPVLFPGGTGSISLTDPDDLLLTGIEVAVRPVGKRIERMSLLSGGERSLAAVALLISIFKARPSPFYVLDEVEAALDDSNLGRLLEVIESLRKSSQLIIVTHQKRTMEIADALYGVSMRQDGMSAVIGQKLESANV